MPSTCYLYFSDNDINVMSLIGNASKNTTIETRKLRNQNLNDVAYYCANNVECRRVQVLRYFGEVFDARNCWMNRDAVCDNCIQAVSAFAAN